MYILESYNMAVFFCIITMLCWGSWANTQKLAAKNWRFELFYWDYVLGILLLAIVFAFTLGSRGTQGRGFLEDFAQASSPNIWSAILGGIIFNAANILIVAAISIAGMSVAFPVGIGIALVLGVIVNYIDAPEGNPILLFAGVSLITLAIILNARAYRRMSADTATPSSKGLTLAITGGILMGFFYRFVARTMFTDFTLPEAGKISPYTAMVLFACGIVLSNLLFNSYIMRKPFAGQPVQFSQYLKGGIRNHITGIIGGMIWCTGMSFSIIASGKAGAAISYGLGQGATVVAAVWGIFIWREFKYAPKGTSTILNIMLALYIGGLAMIIYAR